MLRRRREAPSLLDLLRGSENPIGLSVVILLLWIADADGVLSEEERERLHRVARAAGTGEAIEEILARFGQDPDEGLISACSILRTDLDHGERRLVIEMAIGMALEGELSYAQNHILRFLADLFAVPPAELDRLFRAATGRGFPEVGDPGTVEWWQGARESETRWGWQPGGRPRRPRKAPTLDRARALSVLGLGSAASPEEIKAAFRRLSHRHHPDRFASLGTEAIEAATLRFRRIREAYDQLRR